ncbi:hypothetical protein [Planktotalea sp.]|uniref:hypothetical protein n=1 Tax=Planktotalea sp. TaxID=2029877 RepID=UPI00329A7766
MRKSTTHWTFIAALSLAATSPALSSAQTVDVDQMSFFVTSESKGDGGNLGGLKGADAHCNALASAAGSDKNWAAYLSTSMVVDRSNGRPFKITNGVNARDRIGSGPWYNAMGMMIAKDIDALHSADGNFISIETALNEKGGKINGRGTPPNQHDILTGSESMGFFSTAGGDTTCSNWTSNSAEGSAIVGHHDRMGGNTARNMVSWNSSHGTFGCGEQHLPRSGGAGLFYCFATE